MRSVSSSDVICSISMRWRNCGVRTSRCERLVVNLRDIPQIRLPSIEFIFSDCCGLWPHGRIITDQEPSLCNLCALCASVVKIVRLPQPLRHREHRSCTEFFTCETFRPGKAGAL